MRDDQDFRGGGRDGTGAPRSPARPPGASPGIDPVPEVSRFFEGLDVVCGGAVQDYEVSAWPASGASAGPRGLDRFDDLRGEADGAGGPLRLSAPALTGTATRHQTQRGRRTVVKPDM